MAKDDSAADEDDQPQALDIAIRLERLGRLLRQSGHAGGLVPAQWEILRYLGRANRLSRSPGCVTRYLGTTKGTISQSLLTLEKKGLVRRQTNAADERHVLLDLTDRGHSKLQADPILPLVQGLDELGGKTKRRFARGLAELLSREIGRQGGARFGTCAGCALAKHSAAGNTFQCTVDGATPDEHEQTRLCAVFADMPAA